MNAKQYCQCRLKRFDSETTGWIDARVAKIGWSVELLPLGEMWEVVQVFDRVLLAEDALKENQRLNRNSLPSVKGMQ